MKKILVLALSLAGLAMAARGQTLLYQWAFTNAADTASNSLATYAVTPGTGSLRLTNVAGNIFGTLGTDGINPPLYFTNSNSGPGSGPGVNANGALIANGQTYAGANNAVAIASDLNLGAQYQVTLTFWVQLDATDTGTFARLVQVGAANNYDAGGKGPTANGIGAGLNNSGGFQAFQNGVGVTPGNQNQNPVIPVTSATPDFANGLPMDGTTWIFCAMTYDGTLTVSNFYTWVGDKAQPVQPLNSQAATIPGFNTANYGGLFFTTNATIKIGNDFLVTSGNSRPIRTGRIADVRIYSGIVAQTNLDTIRTFGIPVLTPPSLAPASVLVQPVSGKTYAGQSRTFSVQAIGTPSTFTYLWRSNGVPVPGGTGPSLIVTNVALSANNAVYVCSVTNALGGTNSTPASLTVLPITSGSYAQAVLNSQPYSFWLVNEASNTPSVVVYDYANGHDGVALNPTNMLFLSGPTGPAYPGFPANNTTIQTLGFGGPSQLNMAGPGNYPATGMTILGWVYTPGIGSSLNGIMYSSASTGNQGPAFGLAFGDSSVAGTGTNGGNGSEIDYVWGGAAQLTPMFSSGLDMNMNEWTFMAMVISTNLTADDIANSITADTNVTIYVGSPTLGLNSAVDSTALSGHTIVAGSEANTLALGRSTDPSSEGSAFPYKGTTSSYSGVAVFYSALSPSAIQSMYLNGAGVNLFIANDPNTPGNLLLTYPMGTLQSSGSVNGPYTTVGGASSPWSITTSQPQQFYRVVYP